MVTRARASGSLRFPIPLARTPSRSDLISVGMNGVEAGMVKTRGIPNHTPARPVAAKLHDACLHGARRNGLFGGFHVVRRADMHPGAFKTQAEQPSGLDGAIEHGRHG